MQQPRGVERGCCLQPLLDVGCLAGAVGAAVCRAVPLLLLPVQQLHLDLAARLDDNCSSVCTAGRDHVAADLPWDTPVGCTSALQSVLLCCMLSSDSCVGVAVQAYPLAGWLVQNMLSCVCMCVGNHMSCVCNMSWWSRAATAAGGRLLDESRL